MLSCKPSCKTLIFSYWWMVKMQYPHYKFKNPLPMVGENVIFTLQTKKSIAYGWWKCNTHMTNLKPTTYGWWNAILTWQTKKPIVYGWWKCNTHIMTLNPHCLSKTKIQYPYVKHGTFLMQIYVLVQSIQGEKKFLN